MQPVVSVVVPVYNCEKYLKQCIESVLNQTFKDFELILVDDGSPDRSPAICDAYSQKDTRVKVIHKQNEGVSAARNEGISLACGQYITFVDSDDFIDDLFLTDAINTLQQSEADAYFSGLCMETYENGIITVKKSCCFSYDGNYSVKELLEQANVTYPIICICGPCCKVYKTSIIKQNHLKFRTDMSLGEDTYFNLEVMKKFNLAYLSSKSYYHYRRENADSLFTRFHAETYENVTLIHNLRMQLMQETGCSEVSITEMKSFYFSELVECIRAFFRADRCTEEKKEIIRKVANNSIIYSQFSAKNCNLKKRFLYFLLNSKMYFAVYLLFALRHPK